MSSASFKQKSRGEQEIIIKNAYRILGLTNTASIDEIKNAWRTMQRLTHTDMMNKANPPIDPEKQQIITQHVVSALNGAYEVLKEVKGF